MAKSGLGGEGYGLLEGDSRWCDRLGANSRSRFGGWFRAGAEEAGMKGWRERAADIFTKHDKIAAKMKSAPGPGTTDLGYSTTPHPTKGVRPRARLRRCKRSLRSGDMTKSTRCDVTSVQLAPYVKRSRTSEPRHILQYVTGFLAAGFVRGGRGWDEGLCERAGEHHRALD